MIEFRMVGSLKRGTPICHQGKYYIVGSDDRDGDTPSVHVMFADEHSRGEELMARGTVVEVLRSCVKGD